MDTNPTSAPSLCTARSRRTRLGKLVKGSAYAIVAGIDGHTHHLRLNDIELTGDAPAGAIVEARVYDDANGRRRLSLATRSDLSIEAW